MFHAEYTGQTKVMANLDSLFGKVRNKLVKDAVLAGAEPIRDAAKTAVSRGTGTLHDSVEIKITVKATFTHAWIGPKRGIKIPVRMLTRGKHAGQMLVAIPTRYAHLVEYGHRIVGKGGKVVGFVAAKPFMRPAWGVAGGAVCVANVEKALEAGFSSLSP